MSTDARQSPVLLVDGPVSVYIYDAPAEEINAAIERLAPLIRIAAQEAQKRIYDGHNPKPV